MATKADHAPKPSHSADDTEPAPHPNGWAKTASPRMRRKKPNRSNPVARPRTMFEQRQSDNFFYLLYLPAKRRLRHVETTGRARDVHFFGFISSATAMK